MNCTPDSYPTRHLAMVAALMSNDDGQALWVATIDSDVLRKLAEDDLDLVQFWGHEDAPWWMEVGRFYVVDLMMMDAIREVPGFTSNSTGRPPVAFERVSPASLNPQDLEPRAIG